MMTEQHLTPGDHRVQFDFEIDFSNGGGIQGQGFRLDIDGDDISDEDLATAIVRDLGLLMVGEVRILNKQIVREPHKRSRITLDAGGADGRIELCANTGTYLDSPFHRYPDGIDVADVPLDRLAELDGVVIDVSGQVGRLVDRTQLLPYDVGGKAVLVRTGWDRHWGTDAYIYGHPFLTAAAADHLLAEGAALVGIDSLNIDDTSSGERPVHSALLASGIPICEHLTNLAALPIDGFRFSAVPVKVRGMGTFPVRAYATIENNDER